MRPNEAEDVIRMVESGFNMEVQPMIRPVWVEQISRYRADIATEAVIRLVRETSRRPTLKDLTDMIRERIRATEDPNESWRDTDPDVPQPPEYAHVWWFLIKRGDDRRWCPGMSLPDEDPPDDRLTDAEYQQARADWQQAGSPIVGVRDIVAAIP